MDLLSPLIFLLMLLSAVAQDVADEEDPDLRERSRGPSSKRSRKGSRRIRPKRPGDENRSAKSNTGSTVRPETPEEIEARRLGRLGTVELIEWRLNKHYAKRDPPMLDRPTQVRLGIYVNSFYSISEQTMDYSLNFYLRQAWRDPRLTFDPVDGVKEIKLEEGKWNEIWIPDTFFRNEKGASFHAITVPNRLLKLNATGHMWYVTKISATLSCPMKLQKYPLDTQMCPMMFESFGYTMDTMYFAWLDAPVDVDKGVQLPQFTLQDIILYDCSQNYTAGAFPCLEIRFMLRRDIGFFLIQVYIPSILIVILSWVAFWINIDAIPARVSLGLLTVLAMTTQSTGARSSLPRVSYIKAMDVWMSVCLVFVFASLLEFAVVNVISRREVRTIKPGYAEEGNLLTQCCSGCRSQDPDHVQLPRAPKTVDPAGKRKATNIDKSSRKAFPLSFLFFNVVYWLYYTISSNENEAQEV